MFRCRGRDCGADYRPIEGHEPAVAADCQGEQVGIGDLSRSVHAGPIHDGAVEQGEVAGPELMMPRNFHPTTRAAITSR